jgi:tRNA G26 N,N-dimethylase Trm1
MLSHDFKKNLKAKIDIMGLGNDVLFKLMEIIHFFETDEIRCKWTHLRRTNFRTNLSWTSFGQVVKSF